MTTTEQPELLASDLPVELRVCPHLRRATEGPPVRRVRTVAGDDAWLVASHADVRHLLRDDRLGRSHTAPAQRARYSSDPTFDLVLHTDHAAADAIHAQVRELIKPQFTVRRMQAMRPRVEEFVDRQIDRMLAAGPGVNLRRDFGEPLIRRTLCDLIGVPDAEADAYAELMRRSGEGDMAGAEGYLADLVAGKRAAPDDTVVSRLCERGAGDLQVIQTIMLLGLAGVGGTAKQIVYGVMLLAEQPDVRAAVRADPALLPSTVEELLRLSGSVSLPRYAREDIEVGGVTIGAGDLVLLDLTLANYDGAAFDDPTTFDPARSPNRHMTFSHGVWTCLGAPLARTLLTAVFGAVLTRLPDLRPDGPVDHRTGPLSGGIPDDLAFVW